jgi:integrase/recombinase XerD
MEMLMNDDKNAWLTRFFLYLTEELGYSKHTLIAYRMDLEQFRGSLLDRDLLGATTDDVRSFILARLDSGLSPKSTRRKLSSIKTFFKFVYGERGIEHDPTKHIRAPKAFNTIIRPITLPEVEQVLAAIGAERPLDLRNGALVHVAYGSGLRVSEIVRLKVADLDFINCVAKVRLGKGLKDRFAPLGPREIEAIRAYMEKARPRLVREPDIGYVFVGKHGEILTRQRIWQILVRLSKQTVHRAISPHKYRHAFVTELINRGASYRVVQEMVGHASPQTTTRYMHSDLERVRKEYSQSHPRGIVP